MELINLTTRPINVLKKRVEVINTDERLAITVLDMMFKVMDGEYQTLAVRNYIESVLPKKDHQNLVLPYIKSDEFMSSLAKAFGTTHYRIWTSIDNDVRVVH